MLTKVIRLERLGAFRLRVRLGDHSEGVHDFRATVSEPGPMLSRCGMRPISAACLFSTRRVLTKLQAIRSST